MTNFSETKNLIHVVYGDQPREMVYSLLDHLNLAGRIDPHMVIGLKPNLVVAKPSNSGATTSAQIVEGVIEYLYQNNIRNIWIMESSGVGHSTKKAFNVSGLDSISKRYGNRLKLIDLKDEPAETVKSGRFETRIFGILNRVDYLINLPVVKAHSQTRITCALKNLKGIIPDSEKRKYHSQGLHQSIALLNSIIKPDLIIADGIQGDLTFEEGGTPVRMDRILIAEDPVLLDSYVAALIGYRKEDVRHLMLAEELGIGKTQSTPDQIIELNRSETAPKDFPRSRKLESFARRIDAREACSIFYGSLIHALQRLKRKGRLNRIKEPLHIGQGFKKTVGGGVGVGNCALGFSAAVSGCPPQAIDILRFLEEKVV